VARTEVALRKKRKDSAGGDDTAGVIKANIDFGLVL
jgi:hypothetical protein